MTWNYRVLRYEDGTLGLHEVFYDEDGEVETCTERIVGAMGDDLDEVRADLWHMMYALTLPILEYDEIGGDDEGAEGSS